MYNEHLIDTLSESLDSCRVSSAHPIRMSDSLASTIWVPSITVLLVGEIGSATTLVGLRPTTLPPARPAKLPKQESRHLQCICLKCFMEVLYMLKVLDRGKALRP